MSTFSVFRHLLMLLGLGVFAAAGPASGQKPGEVFEYSGMCEASAAVAVGPDHFLVAEDQTSVLRLYQRGKPDPIGKAWDFGLALGIPPEAKGKGVKTDIEGAAAIGNRIYWITGHSEKWRAQRRFFATDVSKDGDAWKITLAGTPYRELREDLFENETTKDLFADVSLKDANVKKGFNIEGLAAMPGGALLIGFRSPLVNGKALVISLTNPQDVIMTGVPAKFGEVVRLSLGGNGIRSIELLGNRYLIVAGPFKDDANHSLYWWSGVRKDKPVLILDRIRTPPYDDFRPEAMFAIPGTNKVQLLGDEGDARTRPECKDKEISKERKKFRSIVVTIAP